MSQSVELQVISKLLTTEDPMCIDELVSFDESYYSIFKPHIHFILEHHRAYGQIPDRFTFQSEFPDTTLVEVNEPLEYLQESMKQNKQRIILLETFNKLKDLGSEDVNDAWTYISNQCERAQNLDNLSPLSVTKDAIKRANEVIEFNKAARIPTGFPEIDKVMYGGLSTVEELLLVFARTNTGKSWVCTKMMESAQKNGFPVLYYSPEMQGSFLSTRFDTWRTHIKNSDIFRGEYSEDYWKYLKSLSEESTQAYILEDKDVSSGYVNVSALRTLVKRLGIKLLIVDGLSYMDDEKQGTNDSIRFKNICLGLFKISKTFGCAVVVAGQANRDTKDAGGKEDKGEPMPTLYNFESSDHPGRICTQAFSLRQNHETRILDIRLEKARNAENQRPMFSYNWDVNTGTATFIPDGTSMSGTPSPKVEVSSVVSLSQLPGEQPKIIQQDVDDDDLEDVEF